MSHVSDYRAIIDRQIKELNNWIDADPVNALAWEMEKGGTVEDYCGDYGDHWGITAAAAHDVGFPEWERFYEELGPYEDLQDLMS